MKTHNRRKNMLYILLGLTAGWIFATVALIPTAADAAKSKGVIPACAYDGSCDLCGFIELSINIASFGLGVIGGATLLYFVYGGLMLLVSAGNREKITNAKRIIGGTFMGMAVVLLAWTIVNFTIYAFVGGDIKNVSLFGNVRWWEGKCKSLKANQATADKCPAGEADGTTCALSDGSPGLCLQDTCVYTGSFTSAQLNLGYSCKNFAECAIGDPSECANIDSCINEGVACAGSGGDLQECTDEAMKCAQEALALSGSDCIQGACGSQPELVACP